MLEVGKVDHSPRHAERGLPKDSTRILSDTTCRGKCMLVLVQRAVGKPYLEARLAGGEMMARSSGVMIWGSITLTNRNSFKK